MGGGESKALVTTYEAARRDGSACPEVHDAEGTRTYAARPRKRRLRGRTIPPAFVRGETPTVYWQVDVKLSGSATTVTPRIVAPTSTSCPLGRVVARTGPMIGSRMGIDAIFR